MASLLTLFLLHFNTDLRHPLSNFFVSFQLLFGCRWTVCFLHLVGFVCFVFAISPCSFRVGGHLSQAPPVSGSYKWYIFTLRYFLGIIWHHIESLQTVQKIQITQSTSGSGGRWCWERHRCLSRSIWSNTVGLYETFPEVSEAKRDRGRRKRGERSGPSRGAVFCFLIFLNFKDSFLDRDFDFLKDMFSLCSNTM